MTATLSIPAGWLTTALVHSSVPCLLTEPASVVEAMGLGLGPQAAWQRLRDLEKDSFPKIITPQGDYRIVDVEPMEHRILHYTRRVLNGTETGHWGIFLQDGVNDPEPCLLSRDQIFHGLLKVYTDEGIHVTPDEITYSKPVLNNSRLGEAGSIIHDLALQNGHVLQVSYGAGYEQPSIKGLLKFLEHVPLGALTQVDEIRMIAEDNPRQGGAFREGRRLVNVFYPLRSETGATGQNAIKAQFVNFMYAVLHETSGHGLMYRNRFLRREMIKIVASGEEPPTSYARTSIEEWFPEGVAERGMLKFYENSDTSDWDFRYPMLSGLIRHVLGVMEETVEPVNGNIALWKKNLRAAVQNTSD